MLSKVVLLHWSQVFHHTSLHWRHDGHDGVSNHQPRECLLNRLFGRISKKTSKFCVTGLCAGNSPVPVNSPHKGPVTRKMLPFDDVIMFCPVVTYSLKHISVVVGQSVWQLWDDILDTLRPRQNGRHFADDTFKWIFFMKMYGFRLKFHWNLFLRIRLTIFQHWSR